MNTLIITQDLNFSRVRNTIMRLFTLSLLKRYCFGIKSISFGLPLGKQKYAHNPHIVSHPRSLFTPDHPRPWQQVVVAHTPVHKCPFACRFADSVPVHCVTLPVSTHHDSSRKKLASNRNSDLKCM